MTHIIMNTFGGPMGVDRIGGSDSEGQRERKYDHVIRFYKFSWSLPSLEYVHRFYGVLEQPPNYGVLTDTGS